MNNSITNENLRFILKYYNSINKPCNYKILTGNHLFTLKSNITISCPLNDFNNIIFSTVLIKDI